MTRTLLVSGPASAGKSTLIQAVAREHPDHRWHLVQVRRDGPEAREAIRRAGRDGWAGAWQVCCRQEEAPGLMDEVVRQVKAEVGAAPTVIAFEGGADPLLRHAYAYDMRVFVAPPPGDGEALFRSNDEARLELRRILRDSAALGRQMPGASQAPEADDGPEAFLAPPEAGPAAEIQESQVTQFLAQPLGAALAVRVHLRPEFAAMADADIIVINTAAGPAFSEESGGWQRLLGLFGRLRKGSGRVPLIYACDLWETEDPCFVRVRRRVSESLCGV